MHKLIRYHDIDVGAHYVELIVHRQLLVEVHEGERYGRQPYSRIRGQTVPEAGVKMLRADALANLLQQRVGPVEKIRALLEAGKHAAEKAAQSRSQSLAEGYEVRLVDGQEERSDVHRGVSQQRKQSLGG